jgi:hypothetical protein
LRRQKFAVPLPMTTAPTKACEAIMRRARRDVETKVRQYVRAELTRFARKLRRGRELHFMDAMGSTTISLYTKGRTQYYSVHTGGVWCQRQETGGANYRPFNEERIKRFAAPLLALVDTYLSITNDANVCIADVRVRGGKQ